MKNSADKNWFRAAIVVAVFILPVLFPAQSDAQNAAPAPSWSLASSIEDYFVDWFPRVTRIQDEQPHWITPLVTVTPRLEEEYRYDQLWQSQAHGVATDNFGASKGLELIPFQNTEIILGVPGWIAHNGTRKGQTDTDGWADETFLIKYRILSASEENGNYIVTMFMGFSAPTGDDGNSSHHPIFTPTIAAGKGFGDFDVQSTLGIAVPNGGMKRLGAPYSSNTTFQYRLFKIFWPEFEVNFTHWPNGEHERNGQNQLYLTPGVVVGRIPIHERLGLTLGVGEQVAVTEHANYHHSFVFSGRIPF